jgi:sugar (pentulose or hexulose) kinase
MSQHTPAPWMIDGDISTAIDISNGSARIAMIDEQSEIEESELIANAHLIAAAPDLLQALKDLLQATPETYDNRHERIAAQDAIDKAEGQA